MCKMYLETAKFNVAPTAIRYRVNAHTEPDAIWQRDANLGFLLSYNFRPFQFSFQIVKNFGAN